MAAGSSWLSWERGHRLAGRLQGCLPLHDHLHCDRQYGVKEKQTHADTNDVGEVSFRSAGSEAVAAATEQDYSEAVVRYALTRVRSSSTATITNAAPTISANAPSTTASSRLDTRPLAAGLFMRVLAIESAGHR